MLTALFKLVPAISMGSTHAEWYKSNRQLRLVGCVTCSNYIHRFTAACQPPFPTVVHLCPGDLFAVLTELYEVCAEWENIGLGLGLTSGILDSMKGSNKPHKDCLRDMLKEWLNTSPDPCWQSLIQALRSPIVGKEPLARHLEGKFCTQGGSVPHPGNQGCS